MYNFNRYTTKQLRRKLIKCYRVQERTSKFNELSYSLESEINKRNYASIYQKACKVLNNRGFNQFLTASQYTSAVLNSDSYFATDTQHEIGGFHTKSGNPVIVYF